MQQPFAHAAEFDSRMADEAVAVGSFRDTARDHLIAEIQVVEPEWKPPAEITIQQLRRKLEWVLSESY